MLMKIGLVLLIIVVVLTVFKRFSKQQDSEKKKAEESALEMKQDPVCGTFIDETTKHKVKYYEKIYYFCSDDCKQKFIEQKQAENV